MVDTHTADGLKAAQPHREPGVPMVCLETALPAKFAETIREALGLAPPLPAGYADLEGRPLRYEVMDVDVAAIKSFIETHS